MFKASTINHLYPRMNEILPNLFLGDIEASQDLESLNSHNITHIISILAKSDFFVPTHNHVLITLNDGLPYKEKNFEQGIAFIKNALETREGVLVHCMAGISRSSSMVGAYLMKELQHSPQKAISFMQTKREIVDPAYFTFQSAINWVYPKKKFKCINNLCQKVWDYREKYEFFNHAFIGDEIGVPNFSGKRNINECKCEFPNVVVLNN